MRRSGEIPVLALLNPSTIRAPQAPSLWGPGFAAKRAATSQPCHYRSPVISTEAQRSGETPVLALFQRSTKPGCPMSLAFGDLSSQPNAQPHRSPVISTEAQRSGETPVLALLNPSTIRVSHVPRTWGHGFAGCPKQHPKHQTTEIHPNKPTIDPQLRPNDMH